MQQSRLTERYLLQHYCLLQTGQGCTAGALNSLTRLVEPSSKAVHSKGRSAFTAANVTRFDNTNRVWQERHGCFGTQSSHSRLVGALCKMQHSRG